MQNNLAQHIEASCLNNRQLATVVGVTPSMISAYSRGSRTPSLGKAYALARALKVGVYDIWPNPVTENNDGN